MEGIDIGTGEHRLSKQLWYAGDTEVSLQAHLEIQKYPFRLILKDTKGKILTQTRHLIDNDSTQVKLLPFNFIKRGNDNSRSINPVFSLAPGERIYGCGESFTSLNKVGQKVQIFVTDPQGPETDGMYKPVPFFFSNRGYGIFMHTSAPVTCDFGAVSSWQMNKWTSLFSSDNRKRFLMHIQKSLEKVQCFLYGPSAHG